MNVYQGTYKAMLVVFKKVLPKLPKEEKYIDIDVCNELIDTYDKASRQLYKLSLAWTKFSQRKDDRKRVTVGETSSATE